MQQDPYGRESDLKRDAKNAGRWIHDGAAISGECADCRSEWQKITTTSEDDPATVDEEIDKAAFALFRHNQRKAWQH